MGRLLCLACGHAWTTRRTERGRLVVRCRRCREASLPLSQLAETLERWGRPWTSTAPPEPAPRRSGWFEHRAAVVVGALVGSITAIALAPLTARLLGV